MDRGDTWLSNQTKFSLNGPLNRAQSKFLVARFCKKAQKSKILGNYGQQTGDPILIFYISGHRYYWLLWVIKGYYGLLSDIKGLKDDLGTPSLY